MSAGMQFTNFTEDGVSEVFTAWGSMFFQFGDDDAGSDGGGTLTVEFLGADLDWHPFKSISYTVPAEALLTMPRGCKITGRVRLAGSTTPDINVHVFMAIKP